jgi:hypothetical protein
MMAQITDKPDAPDWGIGFHAQQAVEKALKAVLSDRGLEYPRTHDLLLLMELLEKARVQGPPDASDLDSLSVYGAPLRYEDSDVDLGGRLDRAWVQGCVTRTLEWACSTVTSRR